MLLARKDGRQASNLNDINFNIKGGVTSLYIVESLRADWETQK